MEISFDNVKQSQNLIKKLLLSIQQTTETMNDTFEQTVLRHEQQFIKSYRLKIMELVQLFEQLKDTIEDKFINNAMTLQLETVIKERDYFKYQCLKLNSQYHNLMEDHKNLLAQISNTNQQMGIYKYLLQNQKIKNHQIQQNSNLLKQNLTQLHNPIIEQPRILNHQPSNQNFKKEIKQKNEVQEHQTQLALQHNHKIETKQMYELFKVCMDSWKRQIHTKNKKQNQYQPPLQQIINTNNKKQLLRILFTHNQFLKFIQRLLFDDGFKVIFQTTEEKYMLRNRSMLLQYMQKRKIQTAGSPFR